MKNFVFNFVITGILIFASTACHAKVPHELIENACSKLEREDYYGAIFEYTKIIEEYPKDGGVFYSDRGIAKGRIGDWRGALNDFTKSIEYIEQRIASSTRPKPEIPTLIFHVLSRDYFMRGIAKKSLKDLYGAIADYTKAIELSSYIGNQQGIFFFNRGVAKMMLGDYSGAHADMVESAKLGDEEAIKWLKAQQ